MITCSLIAPSLEWSGEMLGKALGSNLIPISFWQDMAWFHTLMPGYEKFHMVILVSICLAI
jgi:hypothetical protein